MQKHPFFPLWFHTDAELADFLPAPLAERVTIHEWPLSCVQRLTLTDGTRLIYKSQIIEGVERAFYAAARSPLLPTCRSLGHFGGCDLLLMEYIDAPRLDSLGLAEAEAVHTGRALVELVRQIPGGGEPPALYASLGSPEEWQTFADLTLARLSDLIHAGRATLTTDQTVAQLSQWANSRAVQALFRPPAVFSHADLSGENAFVSADGYKIIDWQFPRRLPAEFDLACLLGFLGFDPYRHVSAAAADLVWFVRIAWYVEGKRRLFPEGNAYDRLVADLAVKILNR